MRDRRGRLIMPACKRCDEDKGWLQQQDAPPLAPDGSAGLRIVDLFAGCGGLSFGLIEAARRVGARAQVALAVERDRDALKVFKRNIPTLSARQTDVELLFDGDLGGALTLTERRLLRDLGEVDVLVGGPPCQGNSDLNNKTRRDDPRNRLYARMARAAEVLDPVCVIIENVPSVRHDRAAVVAVTREALKLSGYRCREAVLDASHAGVPQRRRRHVLVATRDPKLELAFLTDSDWSCGHVRSLGWAIRDLERKLAPLPFDSSSEMSSREPQAHRVDVRQQLLRPTEPIAPAVSSV